jgi:hypothetical protein
MEIEGKENRKSEGGAMDTPCISLLEFPDLNLEDWEKQTWIASRTPLGLENRDVSAGCYPGPLITTRTAA